MLIALIRADKEAQKQVGSSRQEQCCRACCNARVTAPAYCSCFLISLSLLFVICVNLWLSVEISLLRCCRMLQGREVPDSELFCQRSLTRYSFQFAIVIALITASCFSLSAQTRGYVKGVVRGASGAPVPDAVVVVTNQVTRKVRKARSERDGTYSVQVPAGAYRVNLEPPNVAQFDTGKSYGDFAIARGDTLENVIVEAGGEMTIDIAVGPKPADEKTGPSTTASQRLVAPDRWRFRFPEYERYGDRGARGRDIALKKSRWWDPYNQSV